MELRHLRAFVAVAEERHFSRAAARLHLSQPPLSQQIQALEAELGVRLFERGRAGVRMTAAGEALFPQALALLDQVQRAAELARRAGQGESGTLAIGFAGSMPFSELMPRLLREFRAAWPQVALQLREQPSRAQIDDLVARRLDLGFIRPTRHDRLDALQTRVLQREPLLAAVPESHPLAGRTSIRLHELQDDGFIVYSATLGSALRDHTLALCRRAGFDPRIAQDVHEMPTLVGLVAAGIGVGLVAASMRHSASPWVRYLGIEDPGAHSDIVLAWRRDDASPVVANFLALATPTQEPPAPSAPTAAAHA